MHTIHRRGALFIQTLSDAFRVLAIIVTGIGITGVSLANESTVAEKSFAEVAVAINATMRLNHYNPAELEAPEYRRIEAAITELARVATSDDAFIAGFREIWHDGPFSHVQIRRAEQSAADLADYLDGLRVGGDGASLTWRDNVAVLTVNTMMGLDTIEAVEAAYDEISARNARALVIDLRANDGGAFVVRPLVSHLLSESIDAGGFVSQAWNAMNDHKPNRADIQKVEPWQGWSIKSFWADAQTNPITRIRFSPIQPVYDGPVYVLTSGRTASAAEMATDALRGAARATIVGETTAGEMLSQKIYDLPGGLQLSVPIADYYSASNGRIEGVGIKPDIEVDAADALDVALDQL